MAEVEWTLLGSPGDVAWARIGPAVVAGTVGGRLYLRRPEGGWQPFGLPPGSPGVLDAVVLPGDPLTVAVVAAPASGTDVRVWLSQPDTPGSWTPLGGPPSLPFSPSFSPGGHLAVTSDTFVVVSAAQRLPWIRSGTDPDGLWFPLATDPDQPVSSVAAALGDQQPHIFAVFHDASSPRSTLRVAIRENAAWTWVDLADATASGVGSIALGAMTVRDDSGRFLACALKGLGDLETSAQFLIGSGRSWQRLDLGMPPGNRPISAGAAAADLTVTVRARRDIWTRTPAASWTKLGPMPDARTLVDPVSATAGISQDGDLWEMHPDGAGLRWDKHGHPGQVAAVLGTYRGPMSADGPPAGSITFVLDSDGALWQVETSLQPTRWTHHGQPSSTVRIRATVGLFAWRSFPPVTAWVLVIGSDGHLWSREQVIVEGWNWVDHGAPEGITVKSAAAPTDFDARPLVPVLGSDGHLWMRRFASESWEWVDRGTPQGQLIFTVAGAVSVQPDEESNWIAVAVVITGSGQVWVNVPTDAGFRWGSLGAPTPTEKIVATISVSPVFPNQIDIVVAGASGQIWHRRWSLGDPGKWAALGQPSGNPVTAAVGATAHPALFGRTRVAVVAGERLWHTIIPGGSWTQCDHPDGAVTVHGGRTTGVFSQSGATVIDGDHRAQIVIIKGE